MQVYVASLALRQARRSEGILKQHIANPDTDCRNKKTPHPATQILREAGFYFTRIMHLEKSWIKHKEGNQHAGKADDLPNT